MLEYKKFVEKLFPTSLSKNLKISEKLKEKTKGNLKKIYAGLSIAYETTLAIYIHDLYSVFRNPEVQLTIAKGKLPWYVHLFPWPYPPYNSPPIEPPNPLPSPIITHPMSSMDYAVKFFYDNPILQGVAFAAPFILYGLYYGVKRWKVKKIEK
jgi:hypothetical protein